MADFFETDEEVVKGYDRAIFRRILATVKPYRLLLAAVALALAVSTVGELLVPLVQQRAVDEAIVVKFLALREDAAARFAADAAGGADAAAREGQRVVEAIMAGPGLRAGGMVFAPQGRDTQMSRTTEEALRSAGVLAPGDWYAFALTGAAGERARAVVEAHAGDGLFVTGADAAALPREFFAKLSEDELAVVRGGDLQKIMTAALSLLGILVLVFLSTFAQTWSANLTGQRVMKDLRLALFAKTCGQSTAFLSRHPVGRIVTRLTGDVETINSFFTDVLVAFLKDISVMTGAFITLFLLSPRLAAWSLVCLPPVLAITVVSRVKARDAFRRQRTASSRVSAYLSERLSGVQVVQLFRGEQKSAREFGERNRELLRANLGEMYVFATFRPLVEWLSTLTTAIVLVAGAVMVLDLAVSLGVLIAFVYLIGMFFNPVMDLAEKYTLLQSAMAGGERVFKLLDTDEAIPDRGKRGTGLALRGHIEFDNVRFSYKAGEEVLKGLTFTVNPGEMAAIVGYTGAGKTTITSVLARLWDIDSGEIRLDGVPLRDIPLAELRRACLPVLQDVFLFSGSVADNIRLGLPLSDAEVEEAARAVHAHEFISRLKDGYATQLSEGATNISSGQRQLISFARVIAHNPSVVILDEATSSIDTETERLIQLGIQRVLAGRTSLVIAHRLSTIRHADRILALSGGRLVEEGRHEELIARGGLYAGLYRLQYERAALRADAE